MITTMAVLMRMIRNKEIDNFTFKGQEVVAYSNGKATTYRLTQREGFAVPQDDNGQVGLLIPFNTTEERDDFAKNIGVFVIGRPGR